MRRPRTMLVTTVKNEGPNIAEWVAHHLNIGFDVIQVYQNDSDDGTEKHLRTLQKAGAVEYYKNHCNRAQWQNKAYRRASFSPAYAAADWCMALDGDEFLNVKVGDGKVADLIAACPDADEILVNWKVFGSGHHDALSATPVTERYTLAEADDRITSQYNGFKSLFRTKAFKRPGIHRAKAPLVGDIGVCNGSGLRLDQVKLLGWRSQDPARRALAAVHHYAVRDASSFLLKSARGSSSHPDREISKAYWDRFNINEAPDDSLARQGDRTRAKVAELDDRTNGRLGVLRARSLEIWEEKRSRIMATPEGRALHAALVDGPSGEAIRDPRQS